MKTLSFVFGYARRYVGLLILTVVAMVGLVVVQLVGPLIIRQLIAMVRDQGWNAQTEAQITQLALLALGLYIARGGLQFLRNYMAHMAGWGVVADTRRRIYTHLQKLSLRFYEEQQTGQLMSRMINDSDLFERLIAHAIPDTLVNVFMFVGVLSITMSISLPLALLTMLPVPFIVLAARSFGKYVRPAFRERQKDLAELNATLADNLSGIREIKAFTREHIEENRVGLRIDHYRDSMLHALKLMAVFGPFVEFASSLGYVVVIYFGGRLVFQQAVAIEDLVAFFLYLEMFYQPVRVLSTVWENLQESLAGADRVAELLNVEPDVTDKPGAIDLAERVRGEIEYRDVTFRYATGDTVLEHVSLRVDANSVVALVGPTGVGKSTMASLIPRFYDVCEGAVFIDGHDVRDMTLSSLRRQVSLVLQDVFLFHGTVRENILFGRPGASEEEMIEAAKIANAHEFILQLSEGYDTLIGERGVKLSGGQKQRVSIARAVLKDAPILILDEATSSVDTQTELLIQQALERLMVGRTTIVIAHRLSTIRSADLIVVLEDKGMSQRGTHEQLMARDGLYRHLNEIQALIGAADPQALREYRRSIAEFATN